MSITEAQTKSLTERLPTGLLERVVAHFNPVKVIVFGSQATGKTHKDSDWDLLIVVDDDLPKERLTAQSIYEARRGVRGAIDLIPFRAATFYDRVDIIGSLPWTATNKGVVVYERVASS